LVGVVAGGVLLLGGGFWAGSLVRSPAQEAAEAAGPGPTLLTVPVEWRVLTAQVVTRGDVQAGTQSEIKGPGGLGVVTRVDVAGGAEVRQGQVLAEVSGRPVFALAGALPAHRDLRPGYKGEDVRQLQQALADMGFDPGQVDGVYGAGTKAAVARFYESIGYEPVPASESDDQAQRGAQAAVRQAQWGVDDAVDAAGEAQKAYDKALSAVSSARTDAARNPPEASVDAVKAAEDAVDAAARALRDTQTAVGRARAQLAQAQADQADTAAKTGPTVPLGEYSFIPSFPARVAGVTAVVGQEATSPLLTVASGQLQAVAQVNPGQAALVQVGQPVTVLFEADEVTASGVVAEIASSALPGSFNLVVTPTGEWPAGFWGQNLRLTIDGGSTDGEQLVVPVSALFGSADGGVRVTRVGDDGSQTTVAVTVGVTGNGYAAVTPVEGALAAGDRVAVSADAPESGG
jgi:multidrug efflux pump subunit AcrA (membrane-fusion protein)